jgi:hypothetical protein
MIVNISSELLRIIRISLLRIKRETKGKREITNVFIFNI